MSTVAISACLAGAGFTLALWIVAMLRPREETFRKSALAAVVSLASAGALAFAILWLGGTPRPMSEAHWWLYKSGLAFGFLVGYLSYWYRRGKVEPHRFLLAVTIAIVGGAVFHWIAPTGTDTYAALFIFLVIGVLGGFVWEWNFRKRAAEK